MGEILRRKARWVAKGFSQQEGVNYDETFSSTLKQSSIRLLMALAAKHDLIMELSDVVSAFLEAVIHHDIWVEQPPGYTNGVAGDACKLNRALYGLKQASHEWYETLYTELKQHGFRRVEQDFSIFINDITGVIIGAYVDDLLLIGRNRQDIAAIKAILDKRFRFKHLGDVKDYLGMEVVRTRKKIHINQTKYIRLLLNRLGMEECRAVGSPMEQDCHLEPSPVDFQAKREEVEAYQSLIGALNWLSTMTRPDISLAVSRLARFNRNPTAAHLQAAKRVVRYLAGTRDIGITFDASDNCELQGYSDASWCDDRETSRSTGGYVFKLCNGAVSWSSKLQKLVALSSAESEYIAGAEAAKEALFLGALVKSLGFKEGAYPISLAIDNQAAIKLASNPTNHSATKHINMRYHFLREKVSETKEIAVRWVDTNSQCADPLTKPLGPIKCGPARVLLGLSAKEK